MYFDRLDFFSSGVYFGFGVRKLGFIIINTMFLRILRAFDWPSDFL